MLHKRIERVEKSVKFQQLLSVRRRRYATPVKDVNATKIQSLFKNIFNSTSYLLRLCRRHGETATTDGMPVGLGHADCEMPLKLRQRGCQPAGR